MLVKIKFLTEHGSFKIGDIGETEEAAAKSLVDAGTVELYDPEAEKKAADAKAAEQAAIVKAVAEEVKKELKDTKPDTKAAVITSVKEKIEDDPKHGFKGFGEFAQSVHKGSMQGATPDNRLLVKAVSGSNEGIDSDGGFLVPPEFSQQILQVAFETGQVSNRCFQLPMSTTRIKIPYVAETSRADGSRQGGVRAYWMAEGDQATKSKPTFGQATLDLHKLGAFTYASDELLADASALSAFLNQAAGKELAFQIDEAIINGSGAGQPLGVMTSKCLVTVAKEVGQTAKTLVFDNIIKMWMRMYAAGRTNAVWFINSDTLLQLMTMNMAVGTGGIPVYMPANGLAGQPYGTLFGRPVIEIEHCQTLGTTGDVILADLSQYYLGRKSTDIESASSIHLRFDYGETAFRWIVRVDGQPSWSSDITPKNGSNTVSPIVALATRA